MASTGFSQFGELRAAAFLADLADPATRPIRAAFPNLTLLQGGVAAAMAYLRTAALRPALLFVDLDNETDKAAALSELAQACGRKIQLVALGRDNDVTLYRRLVASGADDYLPKPVDPAEIEEAGRRARRAETEHANTGDGRLVVVTGAHGGAGATTFAVNLSWLLAREQQQRTIVFDLDVQFGTVALALDVVPGPGLIEALQFPSRVDSLLLASTMIPCGDNLAVLAAEDDLGRAATYDEQAVSGLVDALRGDFRWVVVDLPRTMAQSQASLLRAADRIFVLSEPTLPGMRDALRMGTLCQQIGGSAKVELVMNRVGRAGALNERQFAAGVGMPIGWRLPDEGDLVARATADGKCLADQAKGSKLIAEMRRLTDRMAGRGERSKWLPLLRGTKRAA